MIYETRPEADTHDDRDAFPVGLVDTIRTARTLAAAFGLNPDAAEQRLLGNLKESK